MQFGGQRGEFKVVHKSGISEAMVTVKILTHQKEALYNHPGTIEKSALKVRPHPPKGASCGNIHSLERRAPRLRIPLKRLPASGGQSTSLTGP